MTGIPSVSLSNGRSPDGAEVSRSATPSVCLAFQIPEKTQACICRATAGRQGQAEKMESDDTVDSTWEVPVSNGGRVWNQMSWCARVL